MNEGDMEMEEVYKELEKYKVLFENEKNKCEKLEQSCLELARENLQSKNNMKDIYIECKLHYDAYKEQCKEINELKQRNTELESEYLKLRVDHMELRLRIIELVAHFKPTNSSESDEEETESMGEPEQFSDLTPNDHAINHIMSVFDH